VSCPSGTPFVGTFTPTWGSVERNHALQLVCASVTSLLGFYLAGFTVIRYRTMATPLPPHMMQYIWGFSIFGTLAGCFTLVIAADLAIRLVDWRRRALARETDRIRQTFYPHLLPDIADVAGRVARHHGHVQVVEPVAPWSMVRFPLAYFIPAANHTYYPMPGTLVQLADPDVIASARLLIQGVSTNSLQLASLQEANV
jgi:hypothetical protein